MRPLNTVELDGLLYANSITKQTFVGTHPACIYPRTTKVFYSFISNTQTHEQSGEHWNAWIVNGDTVIFFDSFGRDPRSNVFPEYYKYFINMFHDIYWVKTRVQHRSSVMCGYFCIHFIHLLSAGFGVSDFLCEYSYDLTKN